MKLNLFDAFVVIISIIDLIINQINASITVFRTIRILRVARVLRFLTYIKTIQRVIGKQFTSFIYICLLLIILMIIYSLMGVQMYFEKLPSQLGFRQNFDSFFFAFLSVFQLISIENWNDIETLLLNCEGVDILISLLYMLTLIFLGNYVFLNLFLGVLLHGFTTVNLEDKQDQMFDEINGNFDDSKEISMKKEKHEIFQIMMFETENLDKQNLKKRKVNFLYEGIDCKESLWVFTKTNFFRRQAYYMVKSNAFENLLLFVIFLSSLKLAIDTYLNPDNLTEQNIANYIDIGFNSLFFLEALMKIISYGMFMDRGSYLRDTWNQLDFSIVLISVIDMFMTSINLPYVKVL